MKDWVQYKGVNHIVHFDEGDCIKFACGMEAAASKLKPPEPTETTCVLCLKYLKTRMAQRVKYPGSKDMAYSFESGELQEGG